jgi:hypothetical protein
MSTIITRNSANSGSQPSSLVQGELAINVTDGRLFYGSGSGNDVKEFGVTASYALQALSASYAETASYVETAQTASYVLSASYALSSSYSDTSTSASHAINADNAISSSYAQTASYAPDYLPLTGGTINGDVTVNGTASIAFLNVTYESASVIYSSGSNQFGDALNDTQTLWGTVDIKTGPVLVTGSLDVSGGITGSLLGTASYADYATSASHALNADNAISSSYALSASYALSSSYALSASYASTASYVNPLNQTVQITGSLTITGSNTLIGNTSLTGSLNITGSTTQIGNNTLIGNTTLSGSIIISGSENPSTPTIQIYGDTQHTGVVRFNPIDRNIDPSISASYIYVSGSTNDLYFSQNGNGYNNVTRLRWLEGNLYTGLLSGGLISSASLTTFNISSGSGVIVNLNASLNDDPYPTIQYVVWPDLTNQSLTYLTSSIQTFVGINSAGTIIQQTDPWLDGQYNTSLSIGTVLHQNTASINGFIAYPNVAYGYKQRTYDFIKAFGPLKLSGLIIYPSSSLGLTIGSGTAWADGRNYQVDPNNPSYITDPGTSVSKIFRYHVSGSTYIQDTNGGVGYTVIDPANYNDNGVLTPVPSNKPWSNQRVFWYPNSATKGIVVYYGSAIYASQTEAIANLPYENFQETPNTQQNAVYLGNITIKYNGVFTNTNDYIILPGGIFRSVGGSGGGGAVTSTLAGLSDVSIVGPTNGQPLVYYTSSLKWENSSTLTADLVGNASTATTASYALTASYVENAQTASYVLQAVSASYATLAQTANTASYVVTAQTASYVLNAVSASYASSALSSSYALTASYSNTSTSASYAVNTDNAISSSYASTASYVENAQTASYVLQAVSASYAATALSSSYSTTSSYSNTSTSASHALNADNAISSSFATTASYATQALSASYAPSTPAFPYNGDAQISGSLGVTGSFGIQTYDSIIANAFVDAIQISNSDRAIYDLVGTLSINASARRLHDSTGVPSILWENRIGTDSTANPSIDWETRILYDPTNVSSIDWVNRISVDPFGVSSTDWASRQLFNSAGDTAINWEYLSQAQAIDINSYTRKTLTLGTVVENFSNLPVYTTFNPDGEILKGVTLDGTVVNFDLVYLETDNKWYPVAQGTADCSKLLGIAWNVGTGKETILIEGTMVVNDGTYSDTPVVQSINFGLPIYIRESAGNTMSTVVPTTAGQYVRILGHIYYQSTGASNYWVMKFRPSNEWIEL